MHMLHKVLCFCRKTFNNCYYYNIIDYKSDINTVQIKTLELKKIYNKYKNLLLKCNSLEDYLKIRSLKSDTDVSKIKTEIIFNCCNKPLSCKKEYFDTIDQLKIARDELSEALGEIEYLIIVMDQINEYINTPDKNKKYHVKFMLDKYEKIVGFLIDYSNIFSFHSLHLIYGFVGYYTPFKKTSRDKIRMDISVSLSENESHITIIDLFSIKSNLRRKYGTLALNFLLDSVTVINDVLARDELYHFNEMKPISYISGSIVPHKEYISYDELYHFYEINGFIQNGELKKNI